MRATILRDIAENHEVPRPPDYPCFSVFVYRGPTDLANTYSFFTMLGETVYRTNVVTMLLSTDWIVDVSSWDNHTQWSRGLFFQRNLSTRQAFAIAKAWRYRLEAYAVERML